MNSERMHLGDNFKSPFKNDAEWLDLYGEVKEEIPI